MTDVVGGTGGCIARRAGPAQGLGVFDDVMKLVRFSHTVAVLASAITGAQCCRRNTFRRWDARMLVAQAAQLQRNAEDRRQEALCYMAMEMGVRPA